MAKEVRLDTYNANDPQPFTGHDPPSPKLVISDSNLSLTLDQIVNHPQVRRRNSTRTIVLGSHFVTNLSTKLAGWTLVW
jgi:hypothetical protein